MGVVTLKFILTGLPAAIIPNVRATLRVVEEEVGRAAEVLLPMGIVAFAPVVDGGVADGAERRLVSVQHELMVAEDTLQVV